MKKFISVITGTILIMVTHIAQAQELYKFPEYTTIHELVGYHWRISGGILTYLILFIAAIVIWIVAEVVRTGKRSNTPKKTISVIFFGFIISSQAFSQTSIHLDDLMDPDHYQEATFHWGIITLFTCMLLLLFAATFERTIRKKMVV